MAVTASIDHEVNAVRMEITVPPGAAVISIYRIGPSGDEAWVRSWSEVLATPGVMIARDFEAPLGVPLEYVIVIDGVADVATITIPAGDCEHWLTDLARPANSLHLVIEALPELAYEIPTTVHRILGRRPPIVSSDVANTPTFELSMLTATLAQRSRARAALGNGVPVLLRTPPEDGIGNLYFAVLGFNEQRIVSSGVVEARRFVISGVQIERPDPTLYTPTPPATYAHVAATFDSYADLLAQRPTYDALLYDYAGSEPSDLVPWPVEDI